MVDFMLYLTYVIFTATLLLALGFALKFVISNPKGSSKGLFAAIAIVVLFVIIWALTSGQEVLSASGEVMATASQSHMVSAGLIFLYVMLFATVAAAIYATITSALKK